jgi:hypothetical protein
MQGFPGQNEALKGKLDGRHKKTTVIVVFQRNKILSFPHTCNWADQILIDL